MIRPECVYRTLSGSVASARTAIRSLLHKFVNTVYSTPKPCSSHEAYQLLVVGGSMPNSPVSLQRIGGRRGPAFTGRHMDSGCSRYIIQLYILPFCSLPRKVAASPDLQEQCTSVPAVGPEGSHMQVQGLNHPDKKSLMHSAFCRRTRHMTKSALFHPEVGNPRKILPTLRV